MMPQTVGGYRLRVRKHSQGKKFSLILEGENPKPETQDPSFLINSHFLGIQVNEMAESLKWNSAPLSLITIQQNAGLSFGGN